MPVLMGHYPGPEATHGFPILRIADGVKVGEVPRCDPGRGLLLGVVKDTVMFASGSDTTGGDNSGYRLQWTGPDTVAAQLLFVTTKAEKNRPWGNQHEFPTVFDKYWFYRSTLFDATTGKNVGGLNSRSLEFPVVAGHYLIGMAEGTGPAGRGRGDNKAMARFVVVDVQDPANPKVVSDRNLLGFAEPPSDIFIEQYYKDFDPFQFVGYAGAASSFSRMGCPVAVGKRLLLQTPAFLYCIGPAIEGAPGDNPATVQAIRAAKPAELATYLASPSALYRHTAVTAMITAGIDGSKEALTRLVKEDPYEQIRAAAILALNAAEPDAAPGTQALLPLMTAAWIGGGHDGRFERRALQLTLETLGKERGLPLLVAAFTKTDDAAIRQSLVDFAALMGWTAPEFTQQAKAYLASNGLLAVRYLIGLIKTDKEVLDAVKRAYPNLGREANLTLAEPLGQVLEGEEKIAFLLHSIRFWSHSCKASGQQGSGDPEGGDRATWRARAGRGGGEEEVGRTCRDA